MVEHLKDLDNKMMTMNKKEFLKFAFAMAVDLTIAYKFNKEKQSAGDKFYYEFIRLHPELSLRKPQSTSIQFPVLINNKLTCYTTSMKH